MLLDLVDGCENENNEEWHKEEETERNNNTIREDLEDVIQSNYKDGIHTREFVT